MSELHKAVVLEKADGLTWSIQRACGPAKEPGEAISPLPNDVPAAFNGVETANGQTASLPSQAIDGCGWVCGPLRYLCGYWPTRSVHSARQSAGRLP